MLYVDYISLKKFKKKKKPEERAAHGNQLDIQSLTAGQPGTAASVSPGRGPETLISKSQLSR